MIFSDIDNFQAALAKKNSQKTGRIIAFDLGTKKIGVAICDESRSISTPKTILVRSKSKNGDIYGNETDFLAIKNLVLETNSVAILFGLPLKLDGSPTLITNFVLDFAEKFADFWQKTYKNQPNKFSDFLPIMLWDERLSSFEARNRLSEISNNKRKQYDDIAATLILEHFLHDLRNC